MVTEVSCLACITCHQVVLKEPKSALSIRSPGWGLGKDGGSNYTAESQETRAHLLQCLLLTEAGTGAQRGGLRSRLLQGAMRVRAEPSMEPDQTMLCAVAMGC